MGCQGVLPGRGSISGSRARAEGGEKYRKAEESAGTEPSRQGGRTIFEVKMGRRDGVYLARGKERPLEAGGGPQGPCVLRGSSGFTPTATGLHTAYPPGIGPFLVCVAAGERRGLTRTCTFEASLLRFSLRFPSLVSMLTVPGELRLSTEAEGAAWSSWERRSVTGGTYPALSLR